MSHSLNGKNSAEKTYIVIGKDIQDAVRKNEKPERLHERMKLNIEKGTATALQELWDELLETKNDISSGGYEDATPKDIINVVLGMVKSAVEREDLTRIGRMENMLREVSSILYMKGDKESTELAIKCEKSIRSS